MSKEPGIISLVKEKVQMLLEKVIAEKDIKDYHLSIAIYMTIGNQGFHMKY